MLNYVNRQGNPATFETLSEVRAHAMEATAQLSGNDRFPRTLSPKLENFPDNLVYIYRSANLYGGQTAARNNTTFMVFADKRFETKEEGYAYLESLGLIKLIDSAIGTIILEMPACNCGYTEEDLQNYYVLHNVLLSQKDIIEVDGEKLCPSESEYCGGYGKTYMFGIGKGATFMNNFVAGSRDELIGRIAGYFTYGGEMSEEVTVNGVIPAYLVNACPTAVKKFREANKTNAYSFKDGVATFYNQYIPLNKLCVATDEGENVGCWMEKAFKDMLMFYQRSSNVTTKYLEPNVTNAYQGYVEAPEITRFALSERNPIFDNKTVIGNLQVTFMADSERFADIKTPEGDWLDTWYEVVPQEVLNNTAPKHSVPLLLANHGGGDDHLMFLDETGILLMAGRENMAVVAGMHSGITSIVGEAFPRLVKYMLDKFPALDPERVYVTGYSMGGWATYNCVFAHPEIFAAACPMAMPVRDIPETTPALYENLDLPTMLITSTYDFAAWDAVKNHLNEGGIKYLQTFCEFAGLEKAEEFDYAKYPIIGRKTDSLNIKVIDGQWRNFEWHINKDGIPMVGLNVTEYQQHSLWPGFGDILISFFKHFRRNLETGEVIYTK